MQRSVAVAIPTSNETCVAIAPGLLVMVAPTAIVSQPPSIACAVDPVRGRQHLVRDVGRQV